jgi:hypothetical protein
MTTAAWIALVLLVVLAESLGRMLPSIHILDAGPGPSQVISGLRPIVLGIVLAVVFLKTRWGRRESSGLDNLFLDQIESLLQWLRQKWLTGHYCNPSCGRFNVEGWANQLLETRWMLTVPDRLEKRLLYWHTAGTLFVILLVIFIVLIW